MRKYMNNVDAEKKLDRLLKQMPVVAILRGVKPDDVVEIGEAIFTAGIGVIEVPLNSPQPFESISRLARALGDDCIIGCGTLVNKSDVKRVAEAGGQIAVTPNTNPSLIKKCIKYGMIPAPGWATPSEAFSAYKAGARILKLFPAASYGPSHAAAVRAVLPNDAKILAVGGVGSANAAEWIAAGIDGFGIGSEIYKPSMTATEVAERAEKIVNAIRMVKSSVDET
jgi:2-dehydro-3-deoxyphosphogalactonate aldolase